VNWGGFPRGFIDWIKIGILSAFAQTFGEEQNLSTWTMNSPFHVIQKYRVACDNCQKPQAPTPQAPIRNRQTRKVANTEGLKRNNNLG